MMLVLVLAFGCGFLATITLLMSHPFQLGSVHATPTRAPPPPLTIPSFRANPDYITLGQCTSLSWAVDGNIRDVYLDAEPVAAVDTTQRCPTGTTIYTLRARGPGGEVTSTLTVRLLDANYTYEYVQGSMREAPNCATVYLEGSVIDRQGLPQNGVTVRLRFVENAAFKTTGSGQADGEFGFAPINPDYYHEEIIFFVDVVVDKDDPVPLSEPLPVYFRDCGLAGQFTGITFRQQ